MVFVCSAVIVLIYVVMNYIQSSSADKVGTKLVSWIIYVNELGVTSIPRHDLYWLCQLDRYSLLVALFWASDIMFLVIWYSTQLAQTAKCRKSAGRSSWQTRFCFSTSSSEAPNLFCGYRKVSSSLKSIRPRWSFFSSEVSSRFCGLSWDLLP